MSKKSVDSLDYQMDSQQYSLEGTTAQADITGPQIRIEDTEDTPNMGSKESGDSDSNDGSVHMINGTYIPETVNDSFDQRTNFTFDLNNNITPTGVAK